jgi:FkbM family methyltransferase
MRAIVEIGEHSVYVPALEKGGEVFDVGANKGRFSQEVAARFPVKVVSVEANPHLAEILRNKGLDVVECAVGGSERSVSFHIGTNDEASSLRLPSLADVHLVVMQTVSVAMKPLDAILREKGISRLACVKVDIEGSEIDVLKAVGDSAKWISPQWTIEFHDDREFGLCTPAEVDEIIAAMTSNGFSVLVRNWPSRTNVLFVHRSALSIGFGEWIAIKFRYQYAAILWRIINRTFGLIH